MQLSAVDLGIIILYLAATVLIGFMLTRRASKNLNSYFLADKNLPWWILGVSNASGMFDITGTMWLVYLLFVYGLKGVFIPWLWPVFNQIFLMVFLSAWMRRSNVLTGAEWINTRFGYGTGAKLSHISVVIFALVSVVGFLAYDFQGIGKFSALFMPWDLSPNTYALIFMGITTIYVVSGGMYSVVLTELLQFVVMTVASIIVAYIAIMKTSPDLISAAVPEGWKDIFFGWRLDLDWTGLIDQVNVKIAEDGYSLFAIFFMMACFKGILVSMAGPAPNYDMQRILATKSPKEASLMSGFVSVALFFPRFLLIAGLTVLALVFFTPELRQMGANLDFEMILPYAVKNFVPVGALGLLLAGLLAAFMSTFAATVNAAPAYIVNDIYKRYINPNASARRYVFLSYLASFGVVIVGIGFGFYVSSINSVTQWIVNALWGGYTASNVLKWYWWRFNGYGYFWGMMTGIAASLFFPVAFPELAPLHAFPFILLISLVGCVAGSLLTPPEEDEVLKKFYMQVRPWGFWKPIHLKVLRDHPDFTRNMNFKRDMFNVVIGTIWQTTLVVMPIYLVIREIPHFLIAFLVFAVCVFILKKTWYDKLDADFGEKTVIGTEAPVTPEGVATK
ncbi:MAG TPA: Na+:solute symporter [Acidobacteriota bacterium]|nr:Na+:solute symporter [Acidobacteriota bacterium]